MEAGGERVRAVYGLRLWPRYVCGGGTAVAPPAVCTCLFATNNGYTRERPYVALPVPLASTPRRVAAVTRSTRARGSNSDPPSSPRAYPRRPRWHESLLALDSPTLGICIPVAFLCVPTRSASFHPGVHHRTLGPKRTATVAHGHALAPRFASPPEPPRSASSWHLPHHSAPRAVQHLSSTARRRSTLDCTVSLRSSSRARLSMHLSVCAPRVPVA